MQTTAAAAVLPAPTFKWLRRPGFDLGFILGCATLGLLSGAVVVTWPEMFVTVLVLDMWLLGYHHVGATFTRTAFDRESFRTNRFFIVWLPPIVLAVTISVAYLL